MMKMVTLRLMMQMVKTKSIKTQKVIMPLWRRLVRKRYSEILRFVLTPKTLQMLGFVVSMW